MEQDSEFAAALSKVMALACVRNTFLENLHLGISPDSATGDYSDVKVVSPYGEIPWNNLCRINDKEMKTLMREVVDKIYTFLMRQSEPEFIAGIDRLASPFVKEWDEPELLMDFILRKR